MWRGPPAFTVTDKFQIIFPVKPAFLSRGMKKGSYKETLDENVDSQLKQAQCGDQSSLSSTITPDTNSRTPFLFVSLME